MKYELKYLVKRKDNYPCFLWPVFYLDNKIYLPLTDENDEVIGLSVIDDLQDFNIIITINNSNIYIFIGQKLLYSFAWSPIDYKFGLFSEVIIYIKETMCNNQNVIDQMHLFKKVELYSLIGDYCPTKEILEREINLSQDEYIINWSRRELDIVNNELKFQSDKGRIKHKQIANKSVGQIVLYYASLLSALISLILLFLLEEINTIIIVLIVLMVIDFFMALLCVIKDNKFSSRIGLASIAKKSLIFAILLIAALIGRFLDAYSIITAVCLFYISSEGISILENFVVLGVPIPKCFVNIVEKLKGDKG